MRAGWRGEAGLGSVELALLVPAVSALFLLLGHVSEILMAQARLDRAARNLAGTAALMESISDAQMSGLLGGAAAVIAPTPGALALTLTSAGLSDGTFTVRWSDGQAAHSAGETLALEPGTAAAYEGLASVTLLVAEARLAYVSRFAALWMSTFPGPTLTTTLTARATALPTAIAGSPPVIIATTRLTAGGAVQ